MKGAMRSLATKRPQAVPLAAAAPTPASTATPGPEPARRVAATTTVVNATTEPTDRSMPPLTMTRVMPTAHSPTTVVCRAIVDALAADAKPGALSAKNAYATASAASGPTPACPSRGHFTRPPPRAART